MRTTLEKTLMVAVVLIFSFGCSKTQTVPNEKPFYDAGTEQSREWMIGNWLGQAKLDSGRERKWLVERAVDGTFKVSFRDYSEEGYEESVEVGYWGIEQDIYFTITKGWLDGDTFTPADPTSHYYYDAYKVLYLDSSAFEYVSKGTKGRFKLKRVDDSYQLPEH